MTGRRRFDGTPAQRTGLGKSQGEDARRYRRLWARKRRKDDAYRKHENALAVLRSNGHRHWEIS